MSARASWRRSKSHSYKSAQVQIALAKFKPHQLTSKHISLRLYLSTMSMEIESPARGSTNNTLPSFSLGQTYKVEGNNDRTKHFHAFTMFLYCDYIIRVPLPPYSRASTTIFPCFVLTNSKFLLFYNVYCRVSEETQIRTNEHPAETSR